MKLTFNILGIFVLITLAYFIGEYFYSVEIEDTSTEEEGTQESGLLIKLIDGNPVVQISQELQKQAGITGTILKETEYQHSFIARGKIIDLTPLVDLNSKLRQLQTLKSKSAASLEISNKEYRRLQLLHADAANISTQSHIVQFMLLGAKFAFIFLGWIPQISESGLAVQCIIIYINFRIQCDQLFLGSNN